MKDGTYWEHYKTTNSCSIIAKYSLQLTEMVTRGKLINAIIQILFKVGGFMQMIIGGLHTVFASVFMAKVANYFYWKCLSTHAHIIPKCTEYQIFDDYLFHFRILCERIFSDFKQISTIKFFLKISWQTPLKTSGIVEEALQKIKLVMINVVCWKHFCRFS